MIATALLCVALYLFGANVMHDYLIGMIERGLSVLRRENYPPEYRQECRIRGYERLASSSLLWPITLVKLLWLYFLAPDEA